ncbi:hypothetical protein OJ998_08855 [Solirubrobacter taibaiensis]|nr:hypothetical protein [Solirubrobacter taibaiensis]
MEPTRTENDPHEIVQCNVRMPRGLLEDLRALADRSYRPLANEVRFALAEHVQRAKA